MVDEITIPVLILMTILLFDSNFKQMQIHHSVVEL
jgi:hypothetical protein